MKRLCEIALLVLLPALALAVDTPTPTTTPYRSGPEGAIRALYLPLQTVAATAVPTAYGTSGAITNTKPLRSIDITNDLDCAVIAALDGGTADNVVVPSKSALTLELWKLGLYHDKNISIRSTAVCSSGNAYVSGSF